MAAILGPTRRQVDVNAAAQATARWEHAAVGLGQDEPQRILGARYLRRLNGRRQRDDRLPIRLGLIKPPLDRSANVRRDLGAFDAGSIEVIFKVQGKVGSQGLWPGLTTRQDRQKGQ